MTRLPRGMMNPVVSSRETRQAAGWECERIGDFRQLMPADAKRLSWLSPVPLFKSRNDTLVRTFGDPTGAHRQHWVAARLAAGVDPDLTVRTFADRRRLSFLVVGDPGEGDSSQYCVVPGLLERGGDTDFMFVPSDVIYPAGGINEYGDKFYRPYRDYPGPIFAVPGNHDWYDGLHGFMAHFCGTRRLNPGSDRKPYVSIADSPLNRLALRLFWRDMQRPNERKLARMRSLRSRPRQQERQPGPYLAIDAGPVLLVGIDTGILGRVDADQGAWLRRVSRTSPKPKILLTGTPLYVDAKRQPLAIEGSETTVDDIVRDPRHRYIAAIGGDVHNYQRYPVRVDDERTIQYLVAGGGGAFMHDTHTIPRVDLPGVSEADFRCYPLRGDSLSMVSGIFQRKLGWLFGDTYLPPDVAAALARERVGAPSGRDSADREVSETTALITDADRQKYQRILRLPQRFPGALQEYVQRFFDHDDPPLFKSFLRADVDEDEIVIRCYAATGCRAQELDPPLEDELRCVRDAEGTWRWQPVPSMARDRS